MSMLRTAVLSMGMLWLSSNALGDSPPGPEKAIPPNAKVPISIEAQPLTLALNQWARQTGMMMMVSAEGEARTWTAPRVKGEYTPEAALQLLLARSTLSYEFVGTRTVAVKVAKAAQDSRKAQAATEDNQRPLVGERAQEGSPQTGEQSGRGEINAREAGGGSSQKLEEIVVTAQKREQRLFDVPMSIVAVGADELQRRQLTTLEDLPAAVPGLSYVRTGNAYIFQIRGVNNNSGGGALVGMYVDEADVTLGGITNAQIIPVTYDLDRVEVLRGPQGTLYGDGSAGGTIRFLTRNPNLGKFAFDSQVAAMFTEGGDPSQRINTMANVPLIEDRLGLRVAGTFEHDGGWIDQPAAGQKHINTQSLTNLRIKGLWRPDSNLTVSSMVIINREERGRDSSDVGSPHSFTQFLDFTTTPRTRNDYDLYNITLAYDFSSVVQVLNSASYLKALSPSWNSGISLPGDTTYEIYTPSVTTTDHLFTDELRFTSTGSSRWQWTAGGFYRHYRDAQNEPVYYIGVPDGPLPAPLPYSVATRFQAWSAFGDTSYPLGERFTVGAGVRYFREHQDFNNYTADGVDYARPTLQTATFHSIDPRVYAQFKLTPGVNVYTSAAKGFRSGGFNGVDQPTYSPENVWTYELGEKLLALEGHIGFDMAVFLSNYADYQTFGVPTGSAISTTSNVGRARIKGVEASLTWSPLTQWRLEARGSYINARFTEINATEAAYITGDPIDQVPRYQFALSGQHDFVWLGKQGFIRLDYSQKGPETLRNRSSGPAYYAVTDVIRLLNLHASLLLNNSLRVGAFAQNVLNDESYLDAGYILRYGVRSRPRTFGVEFSTTFD